MTNLALLCFYPYRAMEARVMDALAEAGFEITLAQGRLLARIAPGGTRVSDLAEQARVTKQTATFLVDQLEKAGYVERVPDPADARARLVRIAERGQAGVAVARRVEAQVEEEWIRHLGKGRPPRCGAAWRSCGRSPTPISRWSGSGPSLARLAVARSHRHRGAVACSGGVEAEVVGVAGHGAVGVERPLLVAVGVAVPQLDAGAGAGVRGESRHLPRVWSRAGAVAEDLVGVAVAVVDLQQRAVGAGAVGRVDAASGGLVAEAEAGRGGRRRGGRRGDAGAGAGARAGRRAGGRGGALELGDELPHLPLGPGLGAVLGVGPVDRGGV